MAGIRNEERFKGILEKLFYQAVCYEDLFSFFDGEIGQVKQEDVQDFAEQLSIYSEQVEKVFSVPFITIDPDTLNFRINNYLFENVKAVLMLIEGLQPVEFERLCALYLTYLGCCKVNCTPPSHDIKKPEFRTGREYI